ncbi:SDR family NAD(P)-dependent oxidoreductase [Paenibacillus terrae]
MKLTGNTIFITGGGSGIGRGLAEAFYKLGNKVIISGRRKERLEETIKANPGMSAVELNVQDPASIKAVANQLIEEYPDLNVLFNNAGIMFPDDPSDLMDEDNLVSSVTTNLQRFERNATCIIH